MKKTTDESIDPQTVVPARVYRAALARVNEFRREADVRPLKKLPHGTPGCVRECPIWHALVPAMNGIGFEVTGLGIQVVASQRSPDLLHWALIGGDLLLNGHSYAFWRPIEKFIDMFDRPGS